MEVWKYGWKGRDGGDNPSDEPMLHNTAFSPNTSDADDQDDNSHDGPMMMMIPVMMMIPFLTQTYQTYITYVVDDNNDDDDEDIDMCENMLGPAKHITCFVPAHLLIT